MAAASEEKNDSSLCVKFLSAGDDGDVERFFIATITWHVVSSLAILLTPV